MSHGHGGHGVVEGENKKIAILISVLALFLAIAETLGKSAQTDALSSNVEASNLWAFYQAKTIRKTTMETAAEQMEVDLKLAKDPVVKDLLEKRVNELEGAGGALRERAQAERQGRGPQGADGARAAGRDSARRRAGQVPQFRVRLRRVPDRDRARLLLSHHRGHLSAVGRRRPGRAGHLLHGYRRCRRRMRCRSSARIDRLPAPCLDACRQPDSKVRRSANGGRTRWQEGRCAKGR